MAANQTLTTEFNGFIICYCYAHPAYLHVSDTWSVNVNEMQYFLLGIKGETFFSDQS
jgi:hypothetical protein